MKKIIDDLIIQHGPDKIAPIMDKIKNFGFKYATHSGTTWGLDDIQVPKEKTEIIRVAKGKSGEIMSQFNEGSHNGRGESATRHRGMAGSERRA